MIEISPSSTLLTFGCFAIFWRISCVAAPRVIPRRARNIGPVPGNELSLGSENMLELVFVIVFFCVIGFERLVVDTRDRNNIGKFNGVFERLFLGRLGRL